MYMEMNGYKKDPSLQEIKKNLFLSGIYQLQVAKYEKKQEKSFAERYKQEKCININIKETSDNLREILFAIIANRNAEILIY